VAIPAITPYPLPAEDSLPTPRVDWRPDPARAVLLVHDMQRYFVDFFPPGQPPIGPAIRNMVAIRDAADRGGVPVVYTAQPGAMTSRQRGLLVDFWGPGMTADPRHRELVPELAPRPADTLLTKWRYSAFVRTELADLLHGWGRDQLIICGIYAHVGCLMTACDAFSLDVQPFLVADAVADFSAAEHRMALDLATARFAVTPATNAVTTALAGAGAAGGMPPTAPAQGHAVAQTACGCGAMPRPR
jgi:bifunctional isochorismate lyase/aryl carrier protein